MLLLVDGKTVSDYTDLDVVKVFEMLKRYLKVSKDIMEIDGYRVKYVDYHIVSEEEGILKGFEDELVYVAECFKDGVKVEDKYIGMGERGLSIQGRRSILKGVSIDTLNSIILGSTLSGLKKKERNEI